MSEYPSTFFNSNSYDPSLSLLFIAEKYLFSLLMGNKWATFDDKVKDSGNGLDLACSTGNILAKNF